MSASNTSKNWVPFTLYDFFGYLFPGLILTIGFIAYFVSPLAESQFYSGLTGSREQVGDFLHTTLFIFACLVAVYALGHVVATFSHLVFDRIIIGTIFQYPYRSLLGIDEPNWQISWPINKLLFISPILLWLFVLNDAEKAVFWCCLIFLILLSLRLLLTVVTTIIPGWRLSRKNFFYHIFFCWNEFILDKLIIEPARKLLVVDKPFSNDLSIKIRQTLLKRFAVQPEQLNSDNFWLPCLDVIRTSEYSKMINNWLHLYGLNRNICAAFVILSGFSIWNHCFAQFYIPKYEKPFMVVTMLGCIAFGMRYIMLYHTYYSKNVFRAFYILETERDKLKEVVPCIPSVPENAN